MGQAIQNTRQLATSLVPESKSRILQPHARIELLKGLFNKKEVRETLPVLSVHRFRPSFFEKTDQTLQQGRLQFAHQAEAEVIAEQLTSKTGSLKKREEYFRLNLYWEKTLELLSLWDEARLFESAVENLRSTSIQLFPLYYRMEHFPEKPRIEWFWSELSKYSRIQKVSSSELFPTAIGKKLSRKRAHSLEDAAEFLMDELVEDHQNQVVVIPDSPVIRRTLKRIAGKRGLHFQDSRDPTLVTQSEPIKLAILDLELCAKGFARDSVMEWVKYFHPNSSEIRRKIIERASVRGLASYSFSPDLHRALQSLQDRYSSRLTLKELAVQIDESIRTHALPAWTQKVLQKLFQEWEESLKLVEQHHQKKPLLHWFEKLKQKVLQVNPVIHPVRNRNGLRLFRVDQCPSLLLEPESVKVHFFGIGNSYFDLQDVQGDWFSIRDQEILSREYGWISGSEKSIQNLRSFELWKLGEDSTFWEFEYDETGKETESLELVFSEPLNPPVQEWGAHPGLLHSWKSGNPVPADFEALPIRKINGVTVDRWPFSFIQDYGKCPFIAYAQHLLKIQDERDVDVELAADRFGILLHHALEEWIAHPEDLDQVFEKAWNRTPKISWEENERWYRAIRNEVLKLLECFARDDQEYRSRSGAQPLYLEKEVTLNLAGLSLRGRIDRVDEHEDGLIIMDYKTGGQQVDGRKTLDTGKDIQLGLYALAARESFQKEVITAQYLQLKTDRIGRNQGFLFTEWNRSKKDDPVKNPVSTARSGMLSLFTDPPEAIWSQVREKSESLAQAAQEGRFSAHPADPKDCAQCRFHGVCGEARR